MLKIVSIIVLGIPQIISGQIVGNGICDKNSQCIPVTECPEVMQMIDDDTLLEQARTYICGYFHEPLVCCQRDCTTPNGNFGHVKPLNDCPHLKLNRNSRVKEKREFLLESQIGRGDLVCCNEGEDNYKKVEPAPPLTSSPSESQSDPACRTPNGEIAKCVSVAKCQPYNSVETDTDQQFRYVNDSYCGFWDTPMICCGTQHSYTEAYRDNLPENYDCGAWDLTSNSRIPPWLAIIKARDASKFCLGVLINKKYVLGTTACVVNENDVELKIGKCINDDDKDGCDYEISEIIIFPLYQYHHSKDIAIVLLKLHRALEEDFSPICLPDSVLPTNMDMNVITIEQHSGKWTQKETILQTIDNGECHDEMQLYLERIICLQSKDFCTNGKQPLLQNIVLRKTDIDQWYLEGLVNEEGCYEKNTKTFFHAISVYKFLLWIRSNIK